MEYGGDGALDGFITPMWRGKGKKWGPARRPRGGSGEGSPATMQSMGEGPPIGDKTHLWKVWRHACGSRGIE
jgi:hypothetical protein